MVKTILRLMRKWSAESLRLKEIKGPWVEYLYQARMRAVYTDGSSADKVFKAVTLI